MPPVNPEGIRLARYQEKESDEIIRCTLCPWNCRIKEGKYGYCGVRFNKEGRLYTAIYGLLSSIAVDPIEKKPLFHFYPGSRVFSLGTIGCNMRCRHCQNWEIAHSRAKDYMFKLTYMNPNDVVSEAIYTDSEGIALTYNEPTIWFEFAIDVFKYAKEKKLYTVFVTNGFINKEPLKELGFYLDAYRVDVKGFSERAYIEIAGLKRWQAVLEAASLAYNEIGLHVEIVTNIIPGVNDSEEELRNIARWIKNELSAFVPWHVTRFFPYLGFSHKQPTPIETLYKAYIIGKEEGLHFVYTGNVPGDKRENTYCPSCNNLVIERQGYMIKKKETTDGVCNFCGFDLKIVE